MDPKEPKMNKQAVAGTTRDIILTILQALVIIRETWKCYKPEYHYGSI